MVQILLIGVGAGAAAGLLFASLLSGSILSIFLFYVSSLPIMIAAIGWSHWAGLVAAVSAGLGLAIAVSGVFSLTFLVGTGLPGWWLGYLALLARPSADPADTEWYPPGRLVIWAAMLGAGVFIAAIPTFGLDEESFRAGLRNAFESILRVQDSANQRQMPGVGDMKQLVDMLVWLIPYAAATVATLTNIGNLWLAGRIVRSSDRLRRPWPDLTAMTFPPSVPVGLAVAAAGSFLPNIVGTVSAVIAAAILVAYAVLGFAVLHAVTRGNPSRSLILTGTYAVVFVFLAFRGWPAMVMAALGLADSIFDIRGRIARRGPPPRPQT